AERPREAANLAKPPANFRPGDPKPAKAVKQRLLRVDRLDRALASIDPKRVAGHVPGHVARHVARHSGTSPWSSSCAALQKSEGGGTDLGTNENCVCSPTTERTLGPCRTNRK